jgi:hypothetical protein
MVLANKKSCFFGCFSRRFHGNIEVGGGSVPRGVFKKIKKTPLPFQREELGGVVNLYFSEDMYFSPFR